MLLLLSASSAKAATHIVKMSGFQFDPVDLTVNAGDTVTWTNLDSAFHSTTSGTNGVPSGAWNSGLFGRGGSFSFTFNVPAGYYGYYCIPHVFSFHMAGSITVAAANLPPSVSITSPAEGATFTAGTNILLEASATDPDGAIARVDFFSNGNPIGSAQTPPYTATLTNPGLGNYALSAVAVDNQGASSTPAVVHVTVQAANLPPSVNIIQPVEGQTFTAGTNITIQANAMDPDGTISQVEFFVNGSSVGVVTTAPYSLVLSNVTVETFDLTAVARDNQGATSTSPVVHYSVVPAPEPPIIQVPPQNITVLLNSTASFRVSATGTAPLSYQWSFNNLPIAGATNDTLVLANVRTNDAGSYSVIVSNIAGSVTSPAAVLTVIIPINIPPTVAIISPTNGMAFTAPANVTITAEASDPDGSIAQVEFFVGTNSVGQLTNQPYSLVVSNLAAGEYALTAVATDNQGAMATSLVVSISVAPPAEPPVIQISPQSQTAVVGSTVMFSVSATGTPPLSYQWEFNNLAIAGATTNVLVLENVQTNAAGTYRVVISNAAGSVTSPEATLLVNPPPNLPPTVAIGSPTNGMRFPLGASVTVSAEAADSDGTIAQVEFLLGTNSVGTISNSPYTLTISNLIAGDYTVSAAATDDRGATTRSAEVAFSVQGVQIDNVPPTIALMASPRNFARLTSPAITLQGTAADDFRLDRVEFQVNDGPFQPAEGTTSWSTQLLLPAGNDTVRVRSVDLAGNVSRPVTRFFTFVVKQPLALQINGSGTLQHSFDAQNLEIGKVYQIIARSAPGYVFAGWEGVAGQGPKLNFQMASNLVLTAKFVANPFTPLQGAYAGLFLDTNQVSPEGAGFVALQLTDSGNFSGRLTMNEATYPFMGKFDASGHASLPVLRRTIAPVALTLQLDVTGARGQIHGMATTAEGTNVFTSDLLMERNGFTPGTNPAPQAGKWPFVIQTLGMNPDAEGQGSARIAPGGTVRFRGKLAGGANFSFASLLATDGTTPFYLSFNRGQEVFIGWMQFPNDSPANVSGLLFHAIADPKPAFEPLMVTPGQP